MTLAPSAAAIQCERNIRALLKFHSIPVGVMHDRRDDRIFCSMAETDLRMIELERDGKFTRTPTRLLRNHGDTALMGWREDANPSLQVIWHEGGICELDTDKATPRRDLVSLIRHAAEVIRNKVTGKKTDPWEIADGLAKRGIIV